MRRYILIDAELDVVAGDTKYFFVRFLRTVAYARGHDVSLLDLETLTPERAAEVLDIMEGDALGWNYERVGLGPGVEGLSGYEVYEIPERASDATPPILPGADVGQTARIRAFLPPVCFIARVPETTLTLVPLDDEAVVAA